MRTFLALDMPTSLESELQNAIQGLKDRLPDGTVGWVDAASVHLTLKFLGELAPGKLDAVRSKAGALAAEAEPARLTIADFGVFPRLERPRVLWIGVHEDSGKLGQLKSALEQGMEPLGFEPERRRFTPHLTVGRVQRGVSEPERERLISELQTVDIGRLGEMTADELTLFKSELQPGGAVYTALERWTLGGQA